MIPRLKEQALHDLQELAEGRVNGRDLGRIEGFRIFFDPAQVKHYHSLTDRWEKHHPNPPNKDVWEHWWVVAIECRTGSTLRRPVMLEVSYCNGKPAGSYCASINRPPLTKRLRRGDSITKYLTRDTSLSPDEVAILVELGLYQQDDFVPSEEYEGEFHLR